MYLAKTHDVELPMLGSILQSNRVHTDRAIEKVLASGKRQIGMIGLAFKTGTDDLRESPLVLLAEQLIGKGLQLRVYDPDVHLSNLLGANKRFIEERLPHIGALIRRDLESVVAESELLVLGLGDAGTLEKLRGLVREDQIVLDLARAGDPARLRGTYEGLCW
jgi:GDP-mannose 6-dehydrogenase